MKTCRPVPFTDVEITGGFWQKQQKRNAEVTIYAVMNRFMETGRFAAFRCDWREGQPNKPHIFWDSDIAKWMEAVAYLLEKQEMPDLEKVVEETIDEIEKHQDETGYVNSYFTTVEPSMRWSNRRWHELYCAGHLMEAAIAWNHATGRDRFLKIMCRYADYIYRVFVEEDSAAFVTPGHEEIELALVKLYQATGNEKYLQLSKFFVDKRGNNEKDNLGMPEAWDRVSSQSHLPAREQVTAEGHSVRAGYFYSAMADIARECDDKELLSACEKLFDNIAERRMYITGGVGSTRYNEAYTVDYDLPNETAYTETCASIALAYFARRMLLLHADAKYADVIERILYNGFLSSTSLDGKRFYYSNPTEYNIGRRDIHPASSETAWLPAVERVEVFSCSCCPPNITRFVASVGDYCFTEDESTVFVQQYMDCKALISGAMVNITTDYPVSGIISIRTTGLNGRKIALRIPAWCREFELSVPYSLQNGYAYVAGKDAADMVLTLSMQPQLMEANPSIIDDAGKVALQRGPVIYCLEGVDNGGALHNLVIHADTDFTETDNSEFGVPCISAKGIRRMAAEGNWLYRPYAGEKEETVLRFIPFFAMENRGKTDMRVWVPVVD